MKTYILFLFCEDPLHSMESLLKFKKIATRLFKNPKGASTGAITVSIFDSEYTMDELHAIFKKDNLNYLLVEQDSSRMNLPPYLSMLFTGNHSVEDLEKAFDNRKNPNSQNQPQKIGLAEQLEQAVKNEDFILAARIRDKMKTESIKPEELTK